ncbi:ABC transporter permease [Desulfobacula toluolica]|uniref:Predicted oligopeptide/dipeptide ABC transporter, permease protein n=1 Tax=Desulfobacula toluolica (strain DSM 7467 / Tol2) TaxID=651182 RepID=K0NPL1_DESTT|nr:ABC transporter permease [Desulfobacula toluolica]CCK82058.1 predicted oligopeptide/dipeptide ABC transporter, permease protein [Desulfobacula toluolica Tol2]
MKQKSFTVIAYTTALLILIYLSYALPKCLPGDFVTAMYSCSNVILTQQQETQLKEFYSDNEDFKTYLFRVITLDLGYSHAFLAPIWTLIKESLPWTILLLGGANVISLVAGFIIGVETAWRKGSRFEKNTVGSMTVLEGFPEIATGVILLAVFALHLQWFPSSGAQVAYSDFTMGERLTDILYHLALPLLTLVIAYIPGTALLVRNTMIMVLGEKYILTAKSKGLPNIRIRYHHAARNAILPLVTRIGLRMAFMITGALVVETIHSYPGIGTLLFTAIGTRDLPLIRAIVLYSSMGVLMINLLLEFVYPIIDPRIKDA